MRRAAVPPALGTFGVVGDIPAGAFELQRGNGDQPVHGTTAFFVGRKRFICEFLPHLKPVAALIALILVIWHKNGLLSILLGALLDNGMLTAGHDGTVALIH